MFFMLLSGHVLGSHFRQYLVQSFGGKTENQFLSSRSLDKTAHYYAIYKFILFRNKSQKFSDAAHIMNINFLFPVAAWV